METNPDSLNEENKNNLSPNSSELDMSRSNLSFSMFIDKVNDRNRNTNQMINSVDNQFLDTVLPRQTNTWINDRCVTLCYICKERFTLTNRKHHCRLCGRIFCGDCSRFSVIYLSLDKYQLIEREKYLNFCVSGPSITNKSKYRYKNYPCLEKHRICLDCRKIMKSMCSLANLIKVFEILPLTIKDYYKMRAVSKDWYSASTIILSRFREIQYHLPGHIYTSFEKSILKNNFNYIQGHNKLIKNYLKTLNWNKIDDFDVGEIISSIMHSSNKNVHHYKVPCWKLMCSRRCNHTLDDGDIIDLLLSIPNDNLKSCILKYLTNNWRKLISYIPVLCYAARYDNSNNPVSQFLIRKACANRKIASYLYWELKVQLEEIQYNEKYLSFFHRLQCQLLETYKINEYHKFLREQELILNLATYNTKNQLSELLNTQYKTQQTSQQQTTKKQTQNYLLPYSTDENPEYEIKKFFVDDIKQIPSATKPFLIPYLDKTDNKRHILLKHDDIRKDRLITSIIDYADQILKENGLDMEVITYNVLPVSLNSGIIEIVENSTSIYDILQQYNSSKSSILNYILENNSGQSISDIRTRFSKSLAFYSVITYLLGIGDRHLDNILIKNNGSLFHIDFGFVLGKDPKPFSPEIKITDEMIEALGGENSPSHQDFKKYVYQTYDVLRRYPDVIYNMLYLLTKINGQKFDIVALRKEIMNRFLPGEYNTQARLQLRTTISNSKNTINLTDFLHFHYKENTIGNGLLNIVNSAFTATTYIKNSFLNIFPTAYNRHSRTPNQKNIESIDEVVKIKDI